MTPKARAIELLRIAAEFIDINDFESGGIFYDEAHCDGQCLIDDLRAAADALERDTQS